MVRGKNRIVFTIMGLSETAPGAQFAIESIEITGRATTTLL